MKTLKQFIAAAVFATGLATSASSAVTGRAVMSVLPEGGGRGSQQFIEIREEGGKILGHTFASSNSMVSLSYSENRWGGASGGLTNFNDTAQGADGVVGSLPYSSKPPTVDPVSATTTLSGRLNMNGFDLSVAPTKITLNSLRGGFELVPSGRDWKGYGSIGWGPKRLRVELKLNGSLENLASRDPVLFVALFGFPYIR